MVNINTLHIQSHVYFIVFYHHVQEINSSSLSVHLATHINGNTSTGATVWDPQEERFASKHG